MSSRHTGLFLTQIRESLEEPSERAMVTALDPSTCDPLLSEVSLFQPAIANVYTIDRNANFVCSALPLPQGVTPSPKTPDF